MGPLSPAQDPAADNQPPTHHYGTADPHSGPHMPQPSQPFSQPPQHASRTRQPSFPRISPFTGSNATSVTTAAFPSSVARLGTSESELDSVSLGHGGYSRHGSTEALSSIHMPNYNTGPAGHGRKGSVPTVPLDSQQQQQQQQQQQRQPPGLLNRVISGFMTNAAAAPARFRSATRTSSFFGSRQPSMVMPRINAIRSTFHHEPLQSHVPWTPGGQPRDRNEAQLLLDLAAVLVAHGAPLYRVEHRIADAAAALEFPISFFSLPSTMMINLGDGGAQHPSRTEFLKIKQDYNMFKLHQADRLARRLGMVHIRFERLKMAMMARRGVGPGGDLMGAGHTAKHVALDLENEPRRSYRSVIKRPMATPVAERSDSEPVEIMEIIEDLAEIRRADDGYSRYTRIIASSTQSSCLALLLFNGSIADGIASCILGALATTQQIMAEELDASTTGIIFVSMTVSFLSRMAQIKYIWWWLPGSPYGLCHDTVVLSSVVQYMPGTQFTLAMLELGSDHSVAGAVRMFQAFMRSIMVGYEYGIAFGSRCAVFLLQASTSQSCPKPSTAVDWWRMPFFFPVRHRKQWLHMFVTSFIGFVVSMSTSRFMSSDLSAALSSMSLGLVANIWARYRDDIAIASVLSGIFWLVPGSVGIRGAIAAFSQNLATSGTIFGTEIILRTLSIAVGLYVANAIMFPMTPKRRQTDEADALAI
ncbi:hypothetical protein BC831DRAFT_453323 [Entophlyctis helioformis]|nr:hypothetical protein BC831DRAFT_453323 [Entophlyctis helioformis]